MDETLLLRCNSFIENKDRIKSVYKWDSITIHLACSSIYLSQGKDVDRDRLLYCKNLLKKGVGPLSAYKGICKAPISAMLASSVEDPDRLLEKSLHVYGLLREMFWSSPFLPVASVVIAQMTKTSEHVRMASRTRGIYEKMKKLHPFLTSSKDSALCALLSLSDKTDDALITKAMECYEILRPYFRSRSAVQSLSYVLSLYDGTARRNCDLTVGLYNRLKSMGRKYGREYELPSLGALAMEMESENRTAADMVEIDKWLSKQKGFGFWGGISRTQRLMYAGLIAQNQISEDHNFQTAALSGTISVIIAQQAALIAAVSASVAASAAASSS